MVNVEGKIKFVTLNIRQFDEYNNLVYSDSIPVAVEEHDTFSDLLNKMLESSDIKSSVKEDIKGCLRNPKGNRGFTFYIIGEDGERVSLNLKERIAEATNRHGTSQINMDIARIVGEKHEGNNNH